VVVRVHSGALIDRSAPLTPSNPPMRQALATTSPTVTLCYPLGFAREAPLEGDDEGQSKASMGLWRALSGVSRVVVRVHSGACVMCQDIPDTSTPADLRPALPGKALSP
jgi:hypothetical protein